MVKLKDMVEGSHFKYGTIANNNYDESTKKGIITFTGSTSRIDKDDITDEDVRELVFSEEIINLDGKCFSKCKNLESVEFKGYVKDVGEIFANPQTEVKKLGKTQNIFSLAPGDKGILYKTTTNQSISISGCSASQELIRHTNLGAETWFFTKLSSGSEITSNMFQGKTEIENIMIGLNINSIQDNSFKNCTALTHLNFQDVNSQLTLGTGIFEGCTELTFVSIPNTISELPDNCFKDCKKLLTVSLNSNNILSRVGKNCFNGCRALHYVALPNSCTILDDYAFYDVNFRCYVNNQTFYRLPNNIQKIGAYCFAQKSSSISDGYIILDFGNESTTLPEIGEHAFEHTHHAVRLDIDFQKIETNDNNTTFYFYTGTDPEIIKELTWSIYTPEMQSKLKELYENGSEKVKQDIYISDFDKVASLLGLNINNPDDVTELGVSTGSASVDSMIVIPDAWFDQLKDIYFNTKQYHNLEQTSYQKQGINEVWTFSQIEEFEEDQKQSAWYDVRNLKFEYGFWVQTPTGAEKDPYGDTLNETIKRLSILDITNGFDIENYKYVYSFGEAFSYEYPDNVHQDLNKPNYLIYCIRDLGE